MIETPQDRIRKAREGAKFPSAMQAARAMKMPYTTYVGYEKGLRSVDLAVAERLGRFFRVDPVWLLTGRGQISRHSDGIPVMGKVGAGAAVEPVMDTDYADSIDRMDLPDREHLAILIVTGDSQLPRYRDGEAILYDTRPLLPEEVVNQYAICDMADGRRLIKIVRKVNGSFWLESHNAEPESNVRIIACYPVRGMLTGYASPRLPRGVRSVRG
jgi:hypothetical protein